jgi:hypothetical protein
VEIEGKKDADRERKREKEREKEREREREKERERERERERKGEKRTCGGTASDKKSARAGSSNLGSAKCCLSRSGSPFSRSTWFGAHGSHTNWKAR